MKEAQAQSKPLVPAPSAKDLALTAKGNEAAASHVAAYLLQEASSAANYICWNESDRDDIASTAAVYVYEKVMASQVKEASQLGNLVKRKVRFLSQDKGRARDRRPDSVSLDAQIGESEKHTLHHIQRARTAPPGTDVDPAELHAVLESVLPRIPARYEQCLRLILQGFGPADIAEHFGVDKSNAYVISSRARDTLRDALRADEREFVRDLLHDIDKASAWDEVD